LYVTISACNEEKTIATALQKAAEVAAKDYIRSPAGKNTSVFFFNFV
jgi:hypothetical protein